ncbi:unnamed protein product [Thelazia callipaeda]|uniref:2-hydroxyacyl-CoA lyase 2 n=1 Tax=Thelazia callipaeda TaxID=103827 RepID=A0A0N5CV54_THECL|nr:unnamed protein product [Thelazia callipaeda]
MTYFESINIFELMLLLLAIFVLVSAAIAEWLIKFFGIDSIYTFFKILTDLRDGRRSHWLFDLFQVDEESDCHGGQLVALVLKEHNVKEIFTLCGGHISPLLVAVEDIGIRVIDTRHEATAVFAADAVARLRQSIGVAIVTAGPGLTNTITAVKNAQLAETAILIIGGAAPTMLQNRGALQDIDQITLMRPLCKYVARITLIRDIVPVLKKALHIAQSDSPGPCFIEIPVDVLYPFHVVRKEINCMNVGRFTENLLQTYLIAHISRQFSGGWCIKQDIAPIPVTYKLPHGEDIKKFAHLLMEADKPILILGSQALLAPIKAKKLQKVVKAINIPTYLSGMSRGLLGHSNAIHFSHTRKLAMQEADLIILAGAVCDFRLSYGRSFCSQTKIVSINRSRAQMLKNEGIFWRANLAIQADVATTLVNLHAFLESVDYKARLFFCSPMINGWKSYLATKETENKTSLVQKIIDGSLEEEINPLWVLSLIDKILPKNAIVVADGGDFVGTAAYILHPRGPLQWLDSGAFGTLGVGAGFALGAKAVYPNRPVVIIYGDGACGFSLMEFDTLSRHKLSVIAIIGNDACWSQIAREQIAMFDSDVAVNLSRARYDIVGLALGVQGECISEKKELSRKKLEKIFSSAKDGVSVIVNVIIGKSHFRDGSISV